MPSIYDVNPNALIARVADDLKNNEKIQAPVWAHFVKTGVHNERPPMQEDWWYLRSAAILRTIHRLGPIGVSKLRTKYGGRKNRGVAPDKTFKASGNIIRKILQQLEAASLVKQETKDVHKGRVLTPQGVSLLDKAAGAVYVPLKKVPDKKKTKEEKTEAEKPIKADVKETPKAQKSKKEEAPKKTTKKKASEAEK